MGINFTNVSPSSLKESLAELTLKYPLDYPVVESKDFSGAPLVLEDSIKNSEAKSEKEFDLTVGGAENPIVIKFKTIRTKWKDDFNKEHKYDMLDANLTLEEVLDITEKAGILFQIASNTAKIIAMTDANLKNRGVINSGQLLYSCLVNPEAFKTEIQTLKMSLMSNTKTAEPISNMLEKIDKTKNENLIIDRVRYASVEKVIEWAKVTRELLLKNPVGVALSKDSIVQDANIKPTEFENSEIRLESVGVSPQIQQSKLFNLIG
ncbi:MAG: hypothetical protein ACRC92_27260 [Peptostreptococcaceae bacterium]